MRILTAAALMVSTLLATTGNAAEQKTVAVFTKNMTNPAYEAFRIAADQIARSTDTRVLHFVPKQPDSVDEQKAMVQQVLKDRPDAVIFIPVDDVAMIDSVKQLNEANIPIVLVSNPLPGKFVTLCRRRRPRNRLPRSALSVRASRRQGQDRHHRGHAHRADQP
jgi:ribose transport system substrate-binding protein